MKETLTCPYCGQEKDKHPAEFGNCHICGYKSAIVKSADGADLLIVDRRMPYLDRRCQDLSARMPDISVIIDRRIAQDDISSPDRRQQLSLEEEEVDRSLFQAD